MTPQQIRAAHHFLVATAFQGIPLPPRLRIVRKPLRKAWGYYYDNGVIELCASISTWNKLLRVLAHELCHAATDKAQCDTEEHGPAFKALAADICRRMGWPLRGF